MQEESMQKICEYLIPFLVRRQLLGVPLWESVVHLETVFGRLAKSNRQTWVVVKTIFATLCWPLRRRGVVETFDGLKLKHFGVVAVMLALAMPTFAQSTTGQRHDVSPREIELLALQADAAFREVWRTLFGRVQTTPPSVFRALAQAVSKTPSKGSEKINVLPEGFLLTHLNLRDKALGRLPARRRHLEVVFEVRKLDSQYVGEALSFFGRDIKCRWTVVGNARLQAMTCDNLGQSLSASRHVEFRRFDLDFGRSPILLVEAEQFQNLTQRLNCDSVDSRCLQMSVPQAGAIRIVDNRVHANKRTWTKIQSRNSFDTPKPESGSIHPQVALMNDTHSPPQGEKNGQEKAEEESLQQDHQEARLAKAEGWQVDKIQNNGQEIVPQSSGPEVCQDQSCHQGEEGGEAQEVYVDPTGWQGGGGVFESPDSLNSRFGISGEGFSTTRDPRSEVPALAFPR